MKTQHEQSLAIIGFGAQAKAWARNYRDSTSSPYIVLRENSPSIKVAQDFGFKVISYENELISEIDVFCLLTPDHTHKEILNAISDKFKANAKVIYAHGYSLTVEKLQLKYPNLNHILLAPKAIASEVRFRFENKQNIMTAYSLEFTQNYSENELIQLAKSFGFSKLISTSFLEETNADLFSEQSLLCSLIPYGALHSYNKLRSKGVKKELAFIECWMEVLLIAKAMVEFGPKGLFELISPNAMIGGENAVSSLFNKDFDQKLDEILEDVWSGRFYNQVDKTDFPKLKEEVLNFWKNQEIQSVYDDLKTFL